MRLQPPKRETPVPGLDEKETLAKRRADGYTTITHVLGRI